MSNHYFWFIDKRKKKHESTNLFDVLLEVKNAVFVLQFLLLVHPEQFQLAMIGQNLKINRKKNLELRSPFRIECSHKCIVTS